MTTQTPSPSLLTVEDLSYSYGERKAIRGVSFTVEAGEIFGFLGPNGAGKTTTLACISGLLSDFTGSLRFAGEDFAPGRRAADRARLGVVPQELALYDELSARENLELFGRLNGLAGDALAAAVARALALAGLEQRADERAGAYSGGMKRRLNVALGDLHRPRLLLLDEPTAGVDPQSRNHIFESLRELRDEGRTLIYTTHYMEEAERLCDRIAVINEGEIAAIGTRRELTAAAGFTGADADGVNLEEVFLQLTGRSLRDP